MTCGKLTKRLTIAPDIDRQEWMVEHEVLDFNLITNLKLTVLALHNPIMLIAKIAHSHYSVRQIGNFYIGIGL